jgi:hypothetical protein
MGTVNVLAAGLCLALLEKRVITPCHAETLLIVVGCVVAFLWFRPHTFTARPLEYEATARQTQLIANSFARQKWTLVAPVEQLPESFGLGGYIDLGEFVEKYRGRTSPPAFSFHDPGQSWFIYVEKIPFQIFSREPENVSVSVLMDPAYRNYRSPGGRASLEADALRICEEYRQAHSDMNVFFENEAVRIYQVHEAPDLSNPEQVADN